MLPDEGTSLGLTILSLYEREDTSRDIVPMTNRGYR